ncbi:tripartite motif-containing protein 16-like [Esox lucius]|uniref:Tripartite motif-containing protein 16-like n=1 Tax=Esox lucius TaxID=8010 RepID=A0A3P8XII1_ESOLU|nr:tripartite motif-containing protein 16-like [Esox lucius]
MLAEVVEKVKKTQFQHAPSPLCYAGPGDVGCDFCTGTRKPKALMFCVVCLASFCQTHLQPHYESAAFEKHQLVRASAQLQENICTCHDRLLDVFCRTDQQCICYLCTMDDHKGHDTVSAAAERTEKQRQVGMSHQEVQQRVLEREKNVREIQEAVESLKRSSLAEVENSEWAFTEMICSMERRSSEMKEMIRAQVKAEVSWAEEHQERLEQEISELRRRGADLKNLSHTEDHIAFLRNYLSLSRPDASSDVPNFTVRPLQYFRDVRNTLLELTEKLEDFLKIEWTLIYTAVKDIEVFLHPDPKTREQFLQYSCQLTLDPNTVNKYLFLSDGNRKVTATDQIHHYPEHLDRFVDWPQALCREGLTRQCYWEVEWSGDIVCAAVSYKDINRTSVDYDCGFGHNDKSWRLVCSDNKYWFRHNSVKTEVQGPQSSRVGVYLDHKAGTLSFYSVSSDIMTLLHRVQTMFTQPLYPGFYVWYGSAELGQLEVPYS